jgi:hypothetical protein
VSAGVTTTAAFRTAAARWLDVDAALVVLAGVTRDVVALAVDDAPVDAAAVLALLVAVVVLAVVDDTVDVPVATALPELTLPVLVELLLVLVDAELAVSVTVAVEADDWAPVALVAVVAIEVAATVATPCAWIGVAASNSDSIAISGTSITASSRDGRPGPGLDAPWCIRPLQSFSRPQQATAHRLPPAVRA